MGFFSKEYKKVDPLATQIEKVKPITAQPVESIQPQQAQPIQQIPMQQYQQPMPIPQQYMQQQPQMPQFNQNQLLTPQMNFPAQVPQSMVANNWQNDKLVVKQQLMKVNEALLRIESDVAYVKESIKLLNGFLI